MTAICAGTDGIEGPAETGFHIDVRLLPTRLLPELFKDKDTTANRGQDDTVNAFRQGQVVEVFVDEWQKLRTVGSVSRQMLARHAATYGKIYESRIRIQRMLQAVFFNF